MNALNKTIPVLLLACLSGAAFAKLPALSDEAKAKAAETAAKTAWAGKVDAYQLCKVQDNVAASYYKMSASSGKPTKPATATPPCTDPGAFAYTPVQPVAANTLEAAGAHSPSATAVAPPSGKQTDAVVNPAKKP
jgi:hypothetical protein